MAVLQRKKYSNLPYLISDCFCNVFCCKCVYCCQVHPHHISIEFGFLVVDLVASAWCFLQHDQLIYQIDIKVAQHNHRPLLHITGSAARWIRLTNKHGNTFRNWRWQIEAIYVLEGRSIGIHTPTMHIFGISLRNG